MIIQHNIMSLNAHRQLGGNTNLVSKNLEKLSSGYKINRAGDDAAGLAISEKMRAQITGLTRAQSNAQDGISLVQTAEGALTEVHSMLNRMVDLATQSSNGTMQGDDRQKIQDEINSLTDEIDRISKSTNFNGINLLDGSLGGGSSAGSVTGGYGKVLTTITDGTTGAVTVNSPTATAGTKAKQALTLTAGTKDAEHTVKVDFILDGKAHSITFKGVDATTVPSATTTADAMRADKEAMAKFEALGIKVGGTTTLEFEMMEPGKTDFKIHTASAANGGTAGTAPTIGTLTAGVDRTMTTGAMTGAGDKIQFEIDGKKFQVVKTGEKAEAGYNALFTDTGDFSAANTDATQSVVDQLKDKYNITANVVAQGNISFKYGKVDAGSAGTGNGLTLQIGDTADDFNKVTVSVADMGTAGLGIDGIVVTDQGVAADTIATIKTAIETVSINRSAMGALQNRLEHTINNLGVATENMTAAESRIRDVDMAKEMANFTKNNVLTQAAQAMLAQANQQPQQVLQLLR